MLLTFILLFVMKLISLLLFVHRFVIELLEPPPLCCAIVVELDGLLPELLADFPLLVAFPLQPQNLSTVEELGLKTCHSPADSPSSELPLLVSVLLDEMLHELVL